MLEIDKDFKKVLCLLAQDDVEPRRPVKKEIRAASSTSDGVVEYRQKKGGRRQGNSLSVTLQCIHEHLQKYGEYNIHMDSGKVFKRLESKPDRRRIYDAVRWLEGFGLAKRMPVDKKIVVLILPEDR